MPSDPPLSTRTAFESAAQQFTGAPLEDRELERIWERLAGEARRAETLAAELDRPVEEVAGFLEWSADQHLLARAKLPGEPPVFAVFESVVADRREAMQAERGEKLDPRLSRVGFGGFMVVLGVAALSPFIGWAVEWGLSVERVVFILSLGAFGIYGGVFFVYGAYLHWHGR